MPTTSPPAYATNDKTSQANDDARVPARQHNQLTNRLVWIGIGVLVGVVLLKQIPQARRYLRLESM